MSGRGNEIGGRGRLMVLAAILAVAAVTLAAGAAARSGGSGGRSALPKPGTACAKVGARATGAKKVKLVCAKRRTGKPAWAVVKSSPPPVKTGGGTGGATPPTQGGETLPPSPELVKQGEQLYQNGPPGLGYGCARCHGPDARGNVGPKIVGKSAPTIQQALGIVAQMQGFSSLTGDQIKAIVAYLQSLATAGK